MLGEYTHEQLLEYVGKAGRYAGHAAAMVVNALLNNRPDRVAAWEAESAAWATRGDDLIASGDLKRQLEIVGREAYFSSFGRTVCSHAAE